MNRVQHVQVSDTTMLIRITAAGIQRNLINNIGRQQSLTFKMNNDKAIGFIIFVYCTL
jgi:hypothetical protein